MVSLRFFLLALLIAGLQPPLRAAAGPVEQLIQVAVNPLDPDTMALRYDYGDGGLIYSADGGQSWQLLCTSAIHTEANRIGTLAMSHDGLTLLGVFKGLVHDDGSACSWSKASEVEGQWVSDITVDPIDPTLTYLITSTGAEGSLNGIHRREGSGSWMPLGERKEQLISRLRVADVDGSRRYYQSALQGQKAAIVDGVETMVPNYVIRVSNDDGASWDEFPFDGADGSLRLEGIDPTNPDRILVSTDSIDGDDTLLVSSDGGASFQQYLKLTEFSAIAFAADGRLWIGDSGDTSAPDKPKGLWAATDLGSEPTLLTADYPVNCIVHRPDDSLFVCQRFSAGRADAGDGSFSELVHFKDIDSLLSCDDAGGDTQAACEMQLVEAYCGPTHFPQAPACQPYCVADLYDWELCNCDPDTGLRPQANADGQCPEQLAAMQAPAPMGASGAGAAVDSDAGVGAAGGASEDGGVEGDADGAGSGDADGEGCGACTIGASRAPAGARAALWLLIPAALLRRRRHGR
ncbi:MAG: hypothetical protein OEZ06_17145 [Myxococcales bacterium]|nr:hypothetical protein [Myxococcales bacterium]